jgi:quinol monooxygenase YgiN/mannose-6-phosphate isomerase-like protein (cupin superfamily)
MGGMFALTVRLRVRAGAREEFLAAIGHNAAASIREPGCLRFDVVDDSADLHRFWLYELYRDEAAFEAHKATPHFARWREAAAACIEDQVNEYGTLLPPTAVVMRGDDTPVVDRGGGVRTTYVATRDVGARAFMTGTTEFEPGAFVRPHSHNCEESVVVLAGRGRFECEGRAAEMEAGDATWVPIGATHRFVNIGANPLRILWTYGSAEPTRTFADSGETVAIEPPHR